MNELSQTLEELRQAARALTSAANSLARLYGGEETVPDATPDTAPATRSETNTSDAAPAMAVQETAPATTTPETTKPEEETQRQSRGKGRSKAQSSTSPEPQTQPQSAMQPQSATQPQHMTLDEVRCILSDKCAQGYAAQVKALITALGARTLKDVEPTAYDGLVRAAQALGTGGGADA